MAVFVIGTLLGGTVGLMTASLMFAAKRGDEMTRKEDLNG
ncbi:MAG: DUF3789 domain-containing protein [Ruminococcus sp.]|nr:DUF3789 domain-containing protein [Ruminococcus sp.]